MKRIIITIIAVIVTAYVAKAYASAPGVSARNAVLIDGHSGKILYEVAADSKASIASTTKILTGLIVVERCKLSDVVTIPVEAAGIEGSSMYLKAGEKYTVQELLYGLMLRSGNDAASALAIYCAGSIEKFADMMNEKAAAIGMKSSHFTNPHGLTHEQHFSTARDMGVLAVAAMKNDTFRNIVSKKTAVAGEQTIQNHNKLLWQYEGANGIKTGFTKDAGRCLISSAEREGNQRLIVVTLHAPNDWSDHTRLLDYGFSLSPSRFIFKHGEVKNIEVIGGVTTFVSAVAKRDIIVSVTNEEYKSMKIVWDIPTHVWAPVVGGSQIGSVNVYVGGKLVGSSPVFTENAVDATPEVKGWLKILQERIQKLLSARGIASRRASERLIEEGRVTVNGDIATIGMTVSEEDYIRVNGEPIPAPPKHVYIILYKPRGVVTTLSDEQGRKCVKDLIPPELGYLVPVGRLDLSAEGLLLLTNDGAAVQALTHPSNEVEKTYLAWVQGDLSLALPKLKSPMRIDGENYSPAKAREHSPGLLMITIHEGKNRQVRKMCEAAGLHVTRLKRVSEGKLTLGDVFSGKWRYATEAEIAYIEGQKNKSKDNAER